VKSKSKLTERARDGEGGLGELSGQPTNRIGVLLLQSVLCQQAKARRSFAAVERIGAALINVIKLRYLLLKF
jgi:hypothetical protein